MVNVLNLRDKKFNKKFFVKAYKIFKFSIIPVTFLCVPKIVYSSCLNETELSELVTEAITAKVASKDLLKRSIHPVDTAACIMVGYCLAKAKEHTAGGMTNVATVYVCGAVLTYCAGKTYKHFT